MNKQEYLIEMQISIIVITYNSKADLIVYLDSLINNCSDLSNTAFQIIEASSDYSLNSIIDSYKQKINIRIKFIENKGYAFACNIGYATAPKADIYIYSNPDIIFHSDIIKSIIKKYKRNNYGTFIQKNSLGCNCTFDLYPQYKNIITEFLQIHKMVNNFNIYSPRYCYLTGAFMIFGADVLKDNGNLDENYFLYYEETDYYYRLRENKNFIIIKDEHITHNISSSIDSNNSINKFEIQLKSLLYYSSKFSSYKYIKNIKLFYRITSLFKKSHLIKYNMIRELI